MPFRLLRAALLATVLTVAVPHAAWAADASLRSPADAVVSGATRLVVGVTTTAQDRASHIEVTLRHLDGEVAPDARYTLCAEAATCSRERADYPIDFDPRTGAPFLREEDAQILRNGDYLLRVVVTGEDAAVQTHDLPLIVSAPGTAPAGVTARAERGEVQLSWEPAPESDVAGYLVERATDTGWSLIAEVSAEADSLVDAPGAGVHAYRVVTLRPDGRGATYETVSGEVSVEVMPPGDDPPVAGDESPGPDAPPSGGAADTAPTSTDAPAADTGSETAAPDASAPSPDPGADASAVASPAPGPSFTARTVTEDGELVLGSPDAAADGAPGSSARPVAAIAVGLVFVGLAVRVWRRSRPMHRPPA